MNNIFFSKGNKSVNLKNRSSVKWLINCLFEEEKVALKRIDYIFCSDMYLLKVNRKYLNHNTFTDVITFPLSDKNEPVTGEIYVSIDRVKENAKIYDVSYQNELLRVLIHGALHLCGYNDTTDFKKQEMRSKENFYLKKFNVSREAVN